MQLDHPGERALEIGTRRQRGAQAGGRRFAPSVERSRDAPQLVLAGGEEQGVGGDLLAVVEPYPSLLRAPAPRGRD